MPTNSTEIVTHNLRSKTRFIGKHSRDNRLSIFLNQRNSNAPNELLGLVRINRDALHLINEKGSIVVIGVMARLLCDHGLQFSEHFIYQKETPIFPQSAAISCQEIELVQGVLGDAILPDEYHRGFKLFLPTALPPSCIFLSPDTSMGPGITGDSPWGLTYYLYAYLSTQPHHRKSSKVFLSFTRAMPSDPNQLVREAAPPASTVSRASSNLLSTSKSLTLTAALDRAFFYTGDNMAVQVRIDNPRSVNFTGIRLTLKQLITTRALNQGRQVIKVPLAAYEFKYVDENGKFQRSPTMKSDCSPKDFPFIIDTLRVNLKPGPCLQHVAVESLFPRNSIKSLLLCPSFSQTYEMQDNPLKYFSVEYYMNVHVILPWGSNLIAKLPFTVASRGVNDSESANNTVTIDNLATFSPQEGIDEDEPIQTETLKQDHKSVREPIIQEFTIDFKIVKCDMERSIQILESFRNRNSFSRNSEISLNSFEQMRRTWVREFWESFKIISDGLESLKNLLEIIVTGSGRDKYNSGSPIEFIRGITEKFIPLYNRFLSCHDREHFQVLEEALNQSLDTLELVLMKFHLLSTERTRENLKGEFEVNLDDLFEVLDGRLGKEIEKLTLIIPGMVEWRWFLEELLYYNSSPISDSSSNSGVDDNDFEMAKLFQSIHSRLTESFSDAQILPNEIFTYAKLFFASPKTPSPKSIHAHYSYFRQAVLVYYGNYPEILVPFDGDKNDLKNQDLKKMRLKLGELSEKLIQSMI